MRQFDIILTVVLTAFTGGLGAASLFGSKARLLTPMKKLGGLFEELAKLRGKVKLRGDRKKGGAQVKPSTLADFVTDEKVPEPESPPKRDRNRKDEQDNTEQKKDKDTSSTKVAKLRAAREAQARAAEAQSSLPRKHQKKTVASNGTKTLSGFKANEELPSGFSRDPSMQPSAMLDHAKTMENYEPTNSGANDKGVPGQNAITHAEKQLARYFDEAYKQANTLASALERPREHNSRSYGINHHVP